MFVTDCSRSWYANSTEIRYYKSGEGEVEFGDVKVYEGLFEAWPERQ
jgi:beta-fructofuranosidase